MWNINNTFVYILFIYFYILNKYLLQITDSVFLIGGIKKIGYIIHIMGYYSLFGEKNGDRCIEFYRNNKYFLSDSDKSFSVNKLYNILKQ